MAAQLHQGDCRLLVISSVYVCLNENASQDRVAQENRHSPGQLASFGDAVPLRHHAEGARVFAASAHCWLQGMLRVVLLEASGLQTSAEVHCSLRVSDVLKASSKCKPRPNAVSLFLCFSHSFRVVAQRWEEQFEFVVSDPSTQSLDVVVKSNALHLTSMNQLDELGECSIPITALRAGVSVDRWLPLDVPLGSKAGGGEVRLAMQWVPFQVRIVFTSPVHHRAVRRTSTPRTRATVRHLPLTAKGETRQLQQHHLATLMRNT